MANRPVFIPLCNINKLVDEIQIEFEWSPGLAPTQKKKNIINLHKLARKKNLYPLLEVSSKSEVLLGQHLSAFSLKIETKMGKISVESAFQGSKVFEKGGPYIDIYKLDSLAAKKDPRIKNSGRLIGFNYFGQKWPLIPKTAFYDWLYLTALSPYQEYLIKLFYYKGFTDIEFNPKKSINCQARTCAMLVSLLKLNLFNQALKSQKDFIDIVAVDSMLKNHSAELRQGKLL